ncbi:MAG: hydrogenase nickel incorporation protein HypB [Candidatus Hydrogenedentes bacterium]|nr:hydrogenase nickel incorporation protein HypB [Candidatus Hydrogenedentota bacterium]
MKFNVVQKVMKVNDELAAHNRTRLVEADVIAINMMSAPGSGKTSLIEAAAERLKGRLALGVVEGDPETTLDAERISRCDVPVVQVQTAGGCHLEANLVGQALDHLPLQELELVIIENVGNLVCPVEFDLGETVRVAVVSTPEGHDKPAKYPKLFRKADLIVLNKIDLLPYLEFDIARFLDYLGRLNPEFTLIQTSCATGEGIAQWTDWLWDTASVPAIP